MKFRPCIDIHNGKVKQIVGGSLKDEGDAADENFVSEKDAAYFAERYAADGLTGGHVILLNHASSDYYSETKRQALMALKAAPGTLQIGGGIRPDNAREFLNAGATHVIVTSYVFHGGMIDEAALREIKAAAGREHLVLDLSCRMDEHGAYRIVTDRWQMMTDTVLSRELLQQLEESCNEFLIHAVDSEGKSSGPREGVLKILGSYLNGSGSCLPVTYAGGISSAEDLKKIHDLTGGKADFTVGSALDLFGGKLSYQKLADRLYFTC